ncbi:MAG TPA: prephenate dehydratase [Candidatus Saccharimonadales bacterium]|nr:prephenate dehydratase [Candidatus Saccharimonadales bacterium]
MTDKGLDELRSEVDRINQDLVELLNKRAKVAKQIGKAKQGAPVYDPAREAAVLRSVAAANQGPLSDDAVKGIFKEVIAACRAIQQPPRVAYLGPGGTYCEEAARRQCGYACQYLPAATIDEAVALAETDQADAAVVPIENSTEGAVNRTLDILLTSGLKICGEIALPIRHQLITNAKALEGITEVCAHPQALAQCRAWLAGHLPGAKQTPVASNAAAVQIASQRPEVAAIAGAKAAEYYGLPILHPDIHDDTCNTTRFVVLGKAAASPTGNDKTSLVWSVANRPGALLEALAVLSERRINMVKLESRPAKDGRWEYVFYVDVEGHAQDEPLAQALRQLEKQLKLVKVLGSYPKAG